MTLADGLSAGTLRRISRGIGFGGRDDGMDLEVDEVPPRAHPRVQQGPIVACHDLIAVLQIGRHPTVHIGETFRRQAPTLAESLIDGSGVAVAEVFNHHV
jgi:hypothetical protein